MMSKFSNNDNNSSWMISVFLILLLFVGVVISTIQVRNQSNLRGRADTSGGLISCDVDQASMAISSEEQSLLDQVNDYRQQHGLGALVLSDNLRRAATWMSADMLANKYLNHTDSLGRDMSTRAANCGYSGFTFFGENIDSGTEDNVMIFESWKHSPSHNANILNPKYKEAGVALAKNPASNDFYWVFDFGSKEALPTSIPSPSLTPVVSAGLSPVISPTSKPVVSITPTKVPTLVPTKVPSPKPTVNLTKTPTITPTPIIIYPSLVKVDPSTVYSGDKMVITGSGGFKKLWDGTYLEDNMDFQLYLDGQPLSKITCAMNHCEAVYWVSDLAAGTHYFSVDGGSGIYFKVNLINQVPTSPPEPVDTATPTIGPTPTTPPGYEPNPDDMQIFVQAKVGGIGSGGNVNPKHRTRHVSVGIYDNTNKPLTSGNGFVIYDGSEVFGGVIHFGPVPNGVYYVKILADHMLQKVVRPTFQELNSGRLNILPKVDLIQGDINDDNVVNIEDYNLALGCFQAKRCDDATLIDFNDDGTTDVIDYNILLINYWESLGD